MTTGGICLPSVLVLKSVSHEQLPPSVIGALLGLLGLLPLLAAPQPADGLSQGASRLPVSALSLRLAADDVAHVPGNQVTRRPPPGHGGPDGGRARRALSTSRGMDREVDTNSGYKYESLAMENDNDPSSDFEPLFIREEYGDPESNWSTLAFTRTRTSHSSLIGPYLQEMDDLLKSCEDRAAIPLESDPEEMLGEKETSPYFSTSAGNAVERTEEFVSHEFREDMPITSAGNKLSDTMVRFEGHLMGMLAVLENCMEEADHDYVHVKDQTAGNLRVDNQECKTSTEDLGHHFSMNSSELDAHEYSKPSMAVGWTSEMDDVNTTEFPTESLEMEMSFGVHGFETLKSQMEDCIAELQCLERKRKDLLAEVLELRRQEAQEEEEDANVSSKVRELMTVLRKEEEDRREERKREVQLLRSQVAEEERRVWKAEMEKQELRDQMRKLKRQLFAEARESAHVQAAINKRRHEMDLKKTEEVTQKPNSPKIIGLCPQCLFHLFQVTPKPNSPKILDLCPQCHFHSFQETPKLNSPKILDLCPQCPFPSFQVSQKPNSPKILDICPQCSFLSFQVTPKLNSPKILDLCPQCPFLSFQVTPKPNSPKILDVCPQCPFPSFQVTQKPNSLKILDLCP
ncbi:uncharacterized protein sync isoform X2 [Vanacampus margaritifer]